MSCTKPNCNCWEIAVEKANGEYPKYGYLCLNPDGNEDLLKYVDKPETKDSVELLKNWIANNHVTDKTPLKE